MSYIYILYRDIYYKPILNIIYANKTPIKIIIMKNSDNISLSTPIIAPLLPGVTRFIYKSIKLNVAIYISSLKLSSYLLNIKATIKPTRDAANPYIPILKILFELSGVGNVSGKMDLA
jgi:hypothetical protein